MSAGRQFVALVRHGEYEQPAGMPSAHLPHPLNESGRGHALEAAAKLAGEAAQRGADVDPVIDTSRMLRAWETGTIVAEQLAERLGASFRVEEFEALAERCVGAAANLTVDQIAAIVDRDPRYDALPEGWKATSNFRLPFQNAESMLDAGARVADHVERRARWSDETGRDRLKIFVGHGGAFRYAAVHLGVLSLAEVTGLSMHYGGYVVLERIAAGRWTKVGGAWKIRQSGQGPRD
jgi:2,3-bisphosphoglycerate-dependent phosphoglycerate mutase